MGLIPFHKEEEEKPSSEKGVNTEGESWVVEKVTEERRWRGRRGEGREELSPCYTFLIAGLSLSPSKEFKRTRGEKKYQQG
jgi:hypothetical protein